MKKITGTCLPLLCRVSMGAEDALFVFFDFTLPGYVSMVPDWVLFWAPSSMINKLLNY